jgi:hypothetical protein
MNDIFESIEELTLQLETEKVSIDSQSCLFHLKELTKSFARLKDETEPTSLQILFYRIGSRSIFDQERK